MEAFGGALVEKYKVTVMFSAPTAIRVLKKQDPALLSKYDLSSLKALVFSGRAFGRAHCKMDFRGSRQTHHRQLLANRIGLANLDGVQRH